MFVVGCLGLGVGCWLLWIVFDLGVWMIGYLNGDDLLLFVLGCYGVNGLFVL